MASRITIAFVSLCILFCSGCDADSTTDDFEQVAVGDEFGSFFPVELDARASTIADMLGEPDEWLIGDCPCALMKYTSGEAATSVIVLVNRAGNPGYSSAIQIEVSDPYTSQTPHGIGIGAPQDLVEQVLGLPDSTGIFSVPYYEVGWGSAIYPAASIYFSGDTLAYFIRYDPSSRVESLGQIMLRY